MSNTIINIIRKIIAEKMLSESYFWAPIGIRKDTVMYPIGYKNYDAPLGKRERRLKIEISRGLLDQLKRASEEKSRDRLIEALHKEISRNFEQLSPKRRFDEWFIDEDSISNVHLAGRRDCSWK